MVIKWPIEQWYKVRNVIEKHPFFILNKKKSFQFYAIADITSRKI